MLRSDCGPARCILMQAGTAPYKGASSPLSSRLDANCLIGNSIQSVGRDDGRNFAIKISQYPGLSRGRCGCLEEHGVWTFCVCVPEGSGRNEEDLRQYERVECTLLFVSIAWLIGLWSDWNKKFLSLDEFCPISAQQCNNSPPHER